MSNKNVKKSHYNYLHVILGVVVVIAVYFLFFFQVFLGYIVGCLACVLIYQTDFASKQLDKFKNVTSNESEQAIPDKFSCTACNGTDCVRHKEVHIEPWQDLYVHKQLDQAIENFYVSILNNFVTTWYSKITYQSFFVDELKYQLRYASAALLNRALKINFSKLILDKLIPCALHHYTMYCESQKQQLRIPNMTLEQVAASGPFKYVLHVAVSSRESEMKYLRSVSRSIIPILLQSNEVDNGIFTVIIREIFSGWVLLPLMDILADPYILNSLIIIATDNEKLSELPLTPNYRVEFLENFVNRSESVYLQRSKLYRVDVELIMGDQEIFYSFMQYMKSIGKFHILQFTKEIKELQMRLMNPDLKNSEENEAMNNAWEIYLRYIEGPYPVGLAAEISKGFRAGVTGSAHTLRTAPALYAAASHADNLLTNTYIPNYLHSEQFYKLLLGPRVPIGFNKSLKRLQEKSSTASRISSKLKSALKPQTVEGQLLEVMSTAVGQSLGSDPSDKDLLRYLDQLAEHERLEQSNMDKWRVVLTTPEDQRSDSWPRIFNVHVDKGDNTGCFVVRSDSDFHFLRDKLYEFHGHNSFSHPLLPHIRTNGPVELIRYKYEDFIQNLLKQSLLAGSDLLRLFLTATDFQSACAQSNNDSANVYQVLAHRLKKEKGQHLDAFINTFLLSTDVEKYQAMKQSTNRDVEEAIEVKDNLIPESLTLQKPRSIRSDTFCENFDVEVSLELVRSRRKLQEELRGFTKCFLFLLCKVLKVRSCLSRTIGALFSKCGKQVDMIAERYINRFLRENVSERRLAKLVTLGHDVLFGTKAIPKRVELEAQMELAWKQLNELSPGLLRALLGEQTFDELSNVLQMLQYPSLNKQLLYNLFDLCLSEIFPELTADEKKCS